MPEDIAEVVKRCWAKEATLRPTMRDAAQKIQQASGEALSITMPAPRTLAVQPAQSSAGGPSVDTTAGMPLGSRAPRSHIIVSQFRKR